MRLTRFTVSNYRSITDAYQISVHNTTVFLGKNNEGKTNLIKALKLAMDIIHHVGETGRKILPPRLYEWEKDFPIALQNNRRLKHKETNFRLDFSLDEKEVLDFNTSIGSSINGDLSIFIVIKDARTVSITMPKRGKNTTSLTNKICEISKFVNEHTNIQFISAIRSESDAYEVINELIDSELSTINDEKYLEAQNYIKESQNKKLQILSNRIQAQLSTFIPQIKSIDINLEERHYLHRRFPYRNSLSVNIDDGVKTSLEYKGDGIKSLTTMAILSQTDAEGRIIVVDEPEAHLHPAAIHYLRKALFDLSEKNQVIISTHSPIFVNRNNTPSNIIVENGKAIPANRIDDIRKCLGVMMSDNLAYSNYVIVVEGPTDKSILSSLCQRDEKLKHLLQNNSITIHPIGGVNNLKAELYAMERFMCRYIVLLDNDGAAIAKTKEAQEALSIGTSAFRFFIEEGLEESELEDLFDPETYKDYLLESYQIDITKGPFKDKSKKWTTRIKNLARLSGRSLSKNDIDNIKTNVSQIVVSAQSGPSLNQSGNRLMQSIMESIKEAL